MGEIVTLTRVTDVLTPSERALQTLCGRLTFHVALVRDQGGDALNPRTAPSLRDIKTNWALDATTEIIDAANALRALLETRHSSERLLFGQEPRGA